MADAAAKFVGDHNDYKVYLLNADSKENFDEIKDYVLSKFNHLSSVEVINITPALAIHTGPEALGIAIIKK